MSARGGLAGAHSAACTACSRAVGGLHGVPNRRLPLLQYHAPPLLVYGPVLLTPPPLLLFWRRASSKTVIQNNTYVAPPVVGSACLGCVRASGSMLRTHPLARS